MQDRFLRRRHLLASATLSALAAGTSSLDGQDDGARSTPKVCVYTEHFQSLPIPEVCRLFAEMGVDGLDLTVRPGGHIKPVLKPCQPVPMASALRREQMRWTEFHPSDKGSYPPCDPWSVLSGWAYQARA